MKTDKHRYKSRFLASESRHLIRQTSVLICVHLWLLSLGFLSVSAQVRPVNDYGALGLGQLLKRLNTTASVMMIGAHPDDEDSALLAYLARGESARTAYLSLTRGDGGQNIIGPEQSEALGIIRTEELLQARRLDGAEQFFTRAYDYGFSKTLAEAKSKWPEDVIKCDVVRAIRLFRPLVVISRFSGTPADGHGQHQYAGYISPIAVKAAAEPQQCKESGEPWQVLKFYVEQGFRDTSEPTLKINTGKYDPILGRSYYEIAMEGRSMHRSQGEGRIEFHGDSFSGLNQNGELKDMREKNIFDGLDLSPPFADLLQKTMGRNGYVDVADMVMIAGMAENRMSGQDQSYWSTVRANAEDDLKHTGFQIDALADRESAVSDGDLMVSVKVYNAHADIFKIMEITLTAPDKWNVSKIDAPKQNNAAYSNREVAVAGQVFNVTVAKNTDVTEPYWLQSERRIDLFEWPKRACQTFSFDPPILVAHVRLTLGEGKGIVLDQPVQYRFADPARGEIRREVNVVAALSVGVDRDLLIVPQSTMSQTRRLIVSVTNNSDKEASDKVSLNIQAKGLTLDAPNGPRFDLKTRGAKASIPIDITIPPNSSVGSIPIRVSAIVGDAVFDQTMNIVSYSHIQTHRYYTPAVSTVEVLDLKAEPEKVGYIMGSGDEVPEAIRQMGMEVTMLEEKNLASGDLSKFDTIVVGIRASETRPDMMANKQRLLDYVNGGGNLIMQYQRGNFAQSGLAPYPIDTNDKQGTAAGSIARVVDENAAVKILEPTHTIFIFPNKITDEDFKGWVQERNAYNFVTFDPKYTPLLESHDAGEQENKGGLVITKVGKGNWVYCSYSFFRQLPAGVPGAYRLFANLLSLPKAGGGK